MVKETYDKKTALFILLITGTIACNAQTNALEDELEQTRWLALAGLVNPIASTDTTAYPIDNGDGTAYIPAFNLTVTKCSVGVSGDYCETGAAASISYCNALDNSCNSGTDTGTLDGNGTSAVYSACKNLVLANQSTWRVPSKLEGQSLATVDYSYQTYNWGFGWTNQSINSGSAIQFNSVSKNIREASKTDGTVVYCVLGNN